MAIKPPKDRRIRDKIIFGAVGFFGHGLYYLGLMLGLAVIIFSKFGINTETMILYLFSYGFLSVFPKWWLKKRFRVYEYDKRGMSEAEAQARADFGSNTSLIQSLREIASHFRKLRSDPKYARRYAGDIANWRAREEAMKEATIPFYNTTQRINIILGLPVVLYAYGVARLELFIWNQIKKLGKR